MRKYSIWIALLALFPIFTNNVYPCVLSPAAYDLESFLKEKGASTVVFLGTVESLKETHSKAAMSQEMRFTTREWWRGTPQANVVAHGLTTKGTGTSCDGVFDFSVKADEEWLIVADMMNGQIWPSRLLRRRITFGNVPAEVIKILEKKS